MTDFRLQPESGTLELKEAPLRLTVTRAAETWQFFAFVFAALTTFVLTLLDEIPDRAWLWRISAKSVAFFGLAYLMLVNIRVRCWLAGVLVRFKEERR